MSNSVKGFGNVYKIPLTSKGVLQSNDLQMSWTIESSWYSHDSEGLKPDWASGHIHKYEADFGYFVDIWTAVTFWFSSNLQSGD